MDSVVAHIAKTPLFRGLPASQLEKLAAIAQVKKVRRGELVFSDGQEADGFYIVAEGR
ncbi:MAG: Crp/Fnr family transcriptional regulator, partial [Deltaproteobacteria bacterium]